MLNARFRPLWVIGAWAGTVAIIVAASVVLGASLSTSALLLALGIAPAFVLALLAHGQPSATVGQILHSVETKDGR